MIGTKQVFDFPDPLTAVIDVSVVFTWGNRVYSSCGESAIGLLAYRCVSLSVCHLVNFSRRESANGLMVYRSVWFNRSLSVCQFIVLPAFLFFSFALTSLFNFVNKVRVLLLLLLLSLFQVCPPRRVVRRNELIQCNIPQYPYRLGPCPLPLQIVESMASWSV